MMNLDGIRYWYLYMCHLVKWCFLLEWRRWCCISASKDYKSNEQSSKNSGSSISSLPWRYVYNWLLTLYCQWSKESVLNDNKYTNTGVLYMQANGINFLMIWNCVHIDKNIAQTQTSPSSKEKMGLWLFLLQRTNIWTVNC